MEKQIKIKDTSSKKQRWWIKLICLVLSIIAIVYFFNNISDFFFKENLARGEFLKVVLTFVAAIIAILVWKNSIKRVKTMEKQVETMEKQVQMVEEGNLEARFNNALGYFGSEDSTLVLGSIHVLYQIAVKNNNYTKIVHDLFCGHLREKSTKLYENIPEDSGRCPAVIQVLVKYLFGKIDNKYIFKDFESDLSFSTLRNVSFDDSFLVNCWLDRAKLIRCRFINTFLDNCRIYNSELINCGFYNQTTLTNCAFFRRVKLIDCKFRSTNRFTDNNPYEGAKLIDCMFYEGAALTNCNFGHATLTDCKFSLNSTNASLDEFTKNSLDNAFINDSTGESLSELELDSK